MQILSLSGSPDPESATHRLLSAFGSLPEVLAARPGRLMQITGGDLAAVAACGRFRRAMRHALNVELRQRSLLSSYSALFAYLQAEMAHLTAEQMRVLFLTGHNELISNELVSMGTLGEAPHYPREIIHRALDRGAANLIMVHNHPSGDPKPSASDVRTTKRFNELAASLDLCLIDHIIVGRGRCTSLRQEGLF